LTTQQRAGPNSPVNRLLTASPFPLALAKCRASEDLEPLIVKTLRKVRGLRRYNRIATEAAANLEWLESGGWRELSGLIRELPARRRRVERKAARAIDDQLKGFGPKQARNFLQMLGLTRYEIPLDSRVTRWLKDHDFPIRLTAGGLSDPSYYEFVLDGVQALCSKARVLPCIFDACVFASFDDGAWTDDNLLW
jgi:hypothetical protein